MLTREKLKKVNFKFPTLSLKIDVTETADLRPEILWNAWTHYSEILEKVLAQSDEFHCDRHHKA